MTNEDVILNTQYTINFVVNEIEKYYNIKNAKLIDHEEKRIGVGEGFCSIIIKIHFLWEDDFGKLPSNVVLKVPTIETINNLINENEQMKTMMDEEATKKFKEFFINMHNNECSMYLKFGKFYELLRIPHVYSCRKMEKIENPGYLLMQDLSSRGAVVNNADGLSLDQVKIVVQNMARFYAHILKSEDDAWKTCGVVPKQTFEEMKKMQEFGFKPLQMAYPERYSDEMLAKFDFIKNETYVNEIYFPKDMMKSVGIPLGLVHGDLWTNNMIFNESELLAVIDWQTLHAGNVMEDICRLLVSSCHTKVINEHLDEILQLYYTTVEKQYGSQLNFTVSNLKDAFNFAMPFSMIMYASSLTFIADSPAIVGELDDPKRPARKEILIARVDDAMAYCMQPKVIDTFMSVIAKIESIE